LPEQNSILNESHSWFTPNRQSAAYVKRSLLILLLLTVPTLSTFAKDSWYLPASNPVHYLNIASKMQVPHCPVVVPKAVLHVVAIFIPVRPVSERMSAPDLEPPAPTIGVTVSLRHRSPPVFFL
jgi:hypothetical protein